MDQGAGDVVARLADAAWLPPLGPYACFGQRWWLRTTDPALASMLADLFASFACARREDDEPSAPVYGILPVSAHGRGAVERDGELMRSRNSASGLLRHLIWLINRQVIDASLDRLLLHTAAAEVDGRVVLLPAPMESGKTTLVTGLLDRGAAYLTDEAAAVADDLTVTGYPKPLSIDAGARSVLAHHAPDLDEGLAAYHASQWQVQPASFTRVVADGPLGVIVFPRYESGAATELRRLRPVEAVDHAVPCTFAPKGEPVPTAKVRQLAGIATAVPCYALTSGSLDEACDAVFTAAREARAEREAEPASDRRREDPAG